MSASPIPPEALAGLPEPAARALESLAAAAASALGGRLVSVVLFGSAAEGALRAESDVNVVLVLREFSGEGVAAMRETLRAARAAARVEALFLLESEIADAAEAFAVKFADIARRRRVLWGSDPFATLAVPEAALRRRLRQSLLNLALRLREAWAVHGGTDDEAGRSAAGFTGPLRAAAASILALEGAVVPSPKEALRRLAGQLPGDGWPALVEALSAVRERRPLPPGEAGRVLGRLPELASALRDRAGSVS